MTSHVTLAICNAARQATPSISSLVRCSIFCSEDEKCWSRLEEAGKILYYNVLSNRYKKTLLMVYNRLINYNSGKYYMDDGVYNFLNR